MRGAAFALRLGTLALVIALPGAAAAQQPADSGTGQACVSGETGMAAGTGPTPFARADVRAIAERITCYCGCPHLQVSKCYCGTADAIRTDLAAQLDAGRTPDQIVASYVAEHGVWSLAEPPREGFNWVAWLAAPVVLVLGAIGVVAAARRWTHRAPAPAAVPERLEPDAEAHYREVLRRATE